MGAAGGGCVPAGVTDDAATWVLLPARDWVRTRFSLRGAVVPATDVDTRLDHVVLMFNFFDELKRIAR